MRQPGILVFDSGVGGLSIFAELTRRSPSSHYLYVADNAFLPYGDKEPTELVSRVPEVLIPIVEKYKPDIAVVACNTASTLVLDALREKLSIPVVGTVPAIKPAANVSKTKKLAILGTPGTIKTPYTDELIKSFASDCEVYRFGSSELVLLAERKLMGEEILFSDVEIACKQLSEAIEVNDIDTVVLACTHFPHLTDELRKATSDEVMWIDSGRAIADRTLNLLSSIRAQGSPNWSGRCAFFTKQMVNSNSFEAMFRSFAIDSAQLIEI